MRYALLLMVLALPGLQGCLLPVVATGVGTGVLVAEDRRTAGTMAEDQGIEIKASSRIGDKFSSGVHIDVTSYNRMLLLTGQAPDESAKSEIERIARAVDNVRGVANEITVGSVNSLSSRANDT